MEDSGIKYGARIYQLPSGQALVKQTVKGKHGDYVIDDSLPGGDHREAHVDPASDHDLAEAVRLALAGKLKRGLPKRGLP